MYRRPRRNETMAWKGEVWYVKMTTELNNISNIMGLSYKTDIIKTTVEQVWSFSNNATEKV
jgi:hypothetical protein